MTTADDKRLKARVTIETVLIWYLRALGLMFLVGGMIYWARILGAPLFGGVPFTEMGIEWKVATVYFAILNLVAAVGLWLGVSWGSVMWMLSALTQIVMFMGLFDIFGFDMGLVILHIATIAVYFLLTYWVHQEANA